MRVVFLGLSITSSWGNGHATNYRALCAELARRGHDVTFCERETPWYASHRDLSLRAVAGDPDAAAHGAVGWRLCSYGSLEQLEARAGGEIAAADLVLVGSYVPEGRAVAELVLTLATGASAFYDIDTPLTLAQLERDECAYLTPELIPRFDLYLSFAGGPTLERLRRAYGARRPVAFYCLIDPARHAPVRTAQHWDLGYLGTFSADRQGALQSLLITPARQLDATGGRFVVAGPQYPPEIAWPANVERIEHLPPPAHPRFYCAQRFTLNLTRAAMRAAGFSPSVRLFEAAACGTPIITDRWPGLEQFFTPGEEILVASGSDEVVAILSSVSERRRSELAARARRRVLAQHTARRRVDQLEALLGARALLARGRRPRGHKTRAQARRPPRAAAAAAAAATAGTAGTGAGR